MKELIDRPTVFIFRSVSEDSSNDKDCYCEELEKKGLATKIVPVLDFSYKNLDLLRDKLNHPEHFSGIVFTSPRCVRAVVSAVGTSENLKEEWHELINFSVGETTARLVNENLKLHTEGSCAGNGVKLAPIILNSGPCKPLLLPCGNLKMDTLERLLAEGGVMTEAVEVYETVPHPQLESLLSSALSEIIPTYVAFFSPSGIHYSYPLFRKLNLDLDKIKWVSIGPTTAAALQSYNLTVHCAAEKPTPQCLAQSIASSYNHLLDEKPTPQCLPSL